MHLISVRTKSMANISSEPEVSELIYHGPLIGMRSTRPKAGSSAVQPDPTKPKGPASETAHKSSRIAG